MKQVKVVKTMKEAREKLADILSKLEMRDIDSKVAAEMHNNIGKMIGTVGKQLEYSKLRKEKPEIDFMKCH